MNLNFELPHNLDAEQGLLGAIMNNNGDFFDAYGIVSPEDFSHPVHGSIFGKMQDLIQAGKEANPITLKGFFEDDEAFQNMGGGDNYLAELHMEAPLLCNVRDYAEIIAEHAERRQMIIGMREAFEKLQNRDVAPSQIRNELMTIVETGSKSVFVKTKRQVAEEAVKAMEMPKNCFKTGLSSLDTAMAGGLYAGFTYGLCAPEKRGKTTYAHTISHNLNNSGTRHAYIALEMGSTQIEQRNIARDIEVNSMAFLAKNKSADMIRRAAERAAIVPDNTLYLDMPAGTLNQIKSELSRLAAKKQITGFIIDYWQLVKGCSHGQTKADFLYEVAQWVADFSKKQGLWCILLSQLNENGKTLDSRGLSRACDQLYNIEVCSADEANKEYWLNMTHSRYTPVGTIGDKYSPKFTLNTKAGPFIQELE